MAAIVLQVGHFYRDVRPDEERCFEVLAIVQETIGTGEETIQRVLWRGFADPVHLRVGALAESRIEETSREEFLQLYARIVADRDRWDDEEDEEDEDEDEDGL